MRREIAEAHLSAGKSASMSAFLDLRLYSDGDLVLEGQALGSGMDDMFGFGDVEFFTSVGPKDLPRLVGALVVDHFNTIADMNPIWEAVGIAVRRPPLDRTVQRVGKRRTVEFNVKGKLWPLLLDRRQTRKLAFEMVRTASERACSTATTTFGPGWTRGPFLGSSSPAELAGNAGQDTEGRRFRSPTRTLSIGP